MASLGWNAYFRAHLFCFVVALNSAEAADSPSSQAVSPSVNVRKVVEDNRPKLLTRDEPKAVAGAASEPGQVKADSAAKTKPESALENAKKEVVFVGDDPKNHSRPANEDVPVRLNKEAPAPFIEMVLAWRQGDISLANAHADQYIRYLINLRYEVRELTKLIGAALVRQGEIEEEDWVGVEQYLNYESAKQSVANGVILTPSHEQGLARIEADPKGEVEIYYFFTLNCKFCREMAPDVERLWRLVKDNKQVKMGAFTLGPTPKAWADSYRTFTGLSTPMWEGADLAKHFNIAFVPAVVIVSPNNQRAYLKTGAQDFKRLYEFLRTVQGHPTSFTQHAEQLVKTPIGEVEIAESKGVSPYWNQGHGAGRALEFPGLIQVKGAELPRRARDTVDKF